MSWSGFSQTDTVNSRFTFKEIKIDTSVVKLSPRVVRLIIKDLITGDAKAEELKLTNIKLDKVLEREKEKDEKIMLLVNKNVNLDSIIRKQKKQLNLSNELSTKLERELKIEKKNKSIFKITTLVTTMVITTLLITK
jgi:hypothetical protein